MTRKDYELIAEELGRSGADAGSVEEVLGGLFRAFERDNPRFDRERFREAFYRYRDRALEEAGI